jgi:transcriptional regulator with XRE-family HTH domain
MSQRGLAHLAGIDHSAISRILAGREPTLRTAQKLIDAMNGEHPLESAARRVEAALREDPSIGEADRAALMREYVRRRRTRLFSTGQRSEGAGHRRSD